MDYSCKGCDRFIDGVEVQGALLEDDTAVCHRCMTALDRLAPDAFAAIRDTALMGDLHNCADHATFWLDNAHPTCWLCGAVGEASGDAVVFP
jgi:hypothetical protein